MEGGIQEKPEDKLGVARFFAGGSDRLSLRVWVASEPKAAESDATTVKKLFGGNDIEQRLRGSSPGTLGKGCPSDDGQVVRSVWYPTAQSCLRKEANHES